MICPLVNESEWLDLLGHLPKWEPPSSPMLVVAPHPDDETLGAGGLIHAQRNRGCDVAVVAVTDGENAYPGISSLGQLRKVEQTEALEQLGIDRNNIVRFELPDSDLVSKEQELVERLLPLVSADTHLVAPWSGDFHPDHQVCGTAAQQVARHTGATLTSYFFWTWHLGVISTVADLPLVQFPLTPELLQTKLNALSCHRSQLIWDRGDPILPERLLAPAKRCFEVFSTT